ncbi:WG repeat-containing protein [Aquimarina agarivorans]|uniref:WG repeat-containing protein n=1 Tax=Aquimarina agarivorans TaxID=980584 RepID=UPI000495709A
MVILLTIFKKTTLDLKKIGKLGFINECGEIVIDAKFESVTPFKNEIAIVHRGFEIIKNGPYKTQKGGKFGAIDKKGNLIIPYKFDFISEFSENKTATAKIDNRDVTINSKGEIIKS